MYNINVHLQLETAASVMKQAADMPNLAIISLTGNLLTRLPPILPHHLSTLYLIYLENNLISRVRLSTIQPPLQKYHRNVNIAIPYDRILVEKNEVLIIVFILI